MKTFILACALFAAALAAAAQSPSTTTVQGTVYNAAGSPISGTLQITWPAFTSAAGQAIAAGRLTVTIPADGFLSVNLAPNMGALPAGLYYTAVYHLADGTTSTEYWTIPAAPQATLAAVRAQLMPAAQAVQAVNKAYVDQAIQQYATSQVSTFGGTLSGPLYLNGDPLIPTQAADKHYVDSLFAQTLPTTGGAASGPLTATRIGAVYQADQAPGADFTAKLQACINKLDPTYGGVCDARNFPGSITLSGPITIATANATVQLPCATIATAYPIVIAPGTRNVTLHGCATRGASSASGSQGGTAFLSSGSAALFQVGDSAYAADTLGFHLDNVAINTTAASAATAQAIAAWRTQEMQLSSLYLLGNSNQTALTLDGTGNYTGGTFSDIQISGFQIAVKAIGHQISNPAATDWLNAGAFLRLHIDCPTSNGSPQPGTVGIDLQQGDGNTFTGGDVENCATALHLGANAQNNTILGLRNENSTNQVVADPGSSYNNWITGGTMFTGKLTDNGTRNSFLDTFHRSFNALNGDWYGSQQDATLTNHLRLGIGAGNERGLLNRYQTDYGYRWTTGLTDASAGEQFYQVLDELNNVNRLSIGQYNHGQSSTNNQTALNSAGTGAIVLNGSSNAGTGGVVIGSGGATSSTVATIDKSGNANFTGTLQVGGTSQSTGTLSVRNNADAEVDYYLWPGLTTSQKGSFTYKDYNGNSQWYLLKDAANNWALNSAIGGLDSFKAYQSTNSGDTYINAAKSSGTVRVNYESGSGSAFNIYGGNSANLYASFAGPGSIKLPGLAAAAAHNCMQIDNSGWLTNSGQPCGSGTVGNGSSGQIAYYSANGAAVSGLSAVPLSAGGTGASDAPTALANLGAVPVSGGVMTGPLTGTSATFSGTLAIGAMLTANSYASFSAQLAGCNRVGACTILVNGPVSIASSQAIPATVALQIAQGGSFNLSAGVTLTLTSAPTAGRYPIFTGNGAVSFSSAATVFPEWWGASVNASAATNGAAITAAMAADPYGLISFGGGTYPTTNLNLTTPVRFSGLGVGATTLRQTTPAGAFITLGAAAYPSVPAYSGGGLRDLSLLGSASAAVPGDDGIEDSHQHYGQVLENLDISGFGGVGIHSTSGDVNQALWKSITIHNIHYGWGVEVDKGSFQFGQNTVDDLYLYDVRQGIYLSHLDTGTFNNVTVADDQWGASAGATEALHIENGCNATTFNGLYIEWNYSSARSIFIGSCNNLTLQDASLTVNDPPAAAPGGPRPNNPVAEIVRIEGATFNGSAYNNFGINLQGVRLSSSATLASGETMTGIVVDGPSAVKTRLEGYIFGSAITTPVNDSGTSTDRSLIVTPQSGSGTYADKTINGPLTVAGTLTVNNVAQSPGYYFGNPLQWSMAGQGNTILTGRASGQSVPMFSLSANGAAQYSDGVHAIDLQTGRCPSQPGAYCVNNTPVAGTASAASGCATHADLTVNAANSLQVSSAAYSFVGADVGGWIDITGGYGWTPGRYVIQSVTGGSARLAQSPAAPGVTGGSYAINRGRLAFIPGNPSDAYSICAQNAGAYAWQTIAQ